MNVITSETINISSSNLAENGFSPRKINIMLEKIFSSDNLNDDSQKLLS